MKDSLENFIRQNKAAFDDKEPSDKIWAMLSKRLFPRTSLWNSVTVWRAAAVVLLGVCVYLAVPRLQDRKENALALREFKDIESFYISQIAGKIDLLEDHRGSEGMNGLTHDFKQLDAMYQVLKEEMKTRPSRKVQDALVLNLLVQIDLLNQELHKVERSQEKNTEADISKSA
ncbi:MAG TPA: hypothetical protein VFM90_06990 [Cyclobacteriaceae bacterium]|nr:hypothetical protein [Cyclobacteriaceae bacterium]